LTGGILPSLYGLTDPRGERNLSARDAVELLVRGGIRLVQVREKRGPDRQRLEAAREAVALGHRLGATVVVNDRADLALLSLADGVHLGEDDLPDTPVRRLLGPRPLIGVSTHAVAAARLAMTGAASYVALGPIFETRSKSSVFAPLGIDAIAAAAIGKTKPLVVIGGIRPEDVGACLAAGADSVAMIAGLLDGDVERNVAAALSSAARAGVEIS